MVINTSDQQVMSKFHGGACLPHAARRRNLKPDEPRQIQGDQRVEKTGAACYHVIICM
jgi:hypothetical protein